MQRIFLVALAALTGACTSMPDEITAPPTAIFKPEVRVSRLNSPETPGDGGFMLSLENAKYASVEATDTRATPGQQTFADDGQSDHFAVGTRIGMTDTVATGLRIEPDLGTLQANVRKQLYGNSRRNAGKGNISASVSLGYLYSQGTKVEGASDEGFCLFFCSSDVKDKVLDASFTSAGFDTDLMLGYRPADKVVLYTGYFYQDIDYHSHVVYTDRTFDPDTITGRTSSRDTHSGWMRGPMVGAILESDNAFSILLEYLEYDLSWSGERFARKRGSYNASLRFDF